MRVFSATEVPAACIPWQNALDEPAAWALQLLALVFSISLQPSASVLALMTPGPLLSAPDHHEAATVPYQLY